VNLVGQRAGRPDWLVTIRLGISRRTGAFAAFFFLTFTSNYLQIKKERKEERKTK
jgi:hypothetical protein